LLYKNANRILGVLKRNLNIANSDIKENPYITLVRPTVGCASSEELITIRSRQVPHHFASRNHDTATVMVHARGEKNES